MANSTFRGVEDLFIDAATNNTFNEISGGGGGGITEINQENLTAQSVSGTKVNTILGTGSFNSTSTGQGNAVLGYYNLIGNTTGLYNTALGWNVLQANTSGNQNIGIGTFCLTNTTNKSFNKAIGTQTMGSVNGNNNIGIGDFALNYMTGDNNIGIGNNSINGNASQGGFNVGIGYNSLQNVNGSNNIGIGTSAGSLQFQGDNNILLGFNSTPSTTIVSNEITLGNAAITTLRCQATSITSLSDVRDKSDIDKLKVGLDFVEKLNPITFKWDKRDNYENGISDESKKEDKINTGFIAQELKQLQDDNSLQYLNLVYESNPDKLEATYGNLIPVLVKAIQDLSREVKELKSKLV